MRLEQRNCSMLFTLYGQFYLKPMYVYLKKKHFQLGLVFVLVARLNVAILPKSPRNTQNVPRVDNHNHYISPTKERCDRQKYTFRLKEKNLSDIYRKLKGRGEHI